MKKLQRGFTLVELLVVIGILAILTAVVLVAVNPGRQIGQARNTARRADVNAILTAVTALKADPDASSTMPLIATCGAVAPAVDFDYIIDATPDDLTGNDGSLDLEAIVAPLYIADMPEDPQDTAPGAGTGYKICQDVTGIRYTVCADTIEAPATEVPCVTR